MENIDFDYIYRTTTTSYLNLEHLYDFIQDKQSDCYYAAPEMYHQDKENDVKIKFGSGVGFFLSKDLVECVVNNRNKWKYEYLDDVAVGDLLIQDLGYELSNIKDRILRSIQNLKILILINFTIDLDWIFGATQDLLNPLYYYHYILK